MNTIPQRCVENHLMRSDIFLYALQGINIDREYYKGLHKDDLNHNIDHLFDKLYTIMEMMSCENEEMWDVISDKGQQ